MNTMKLSVAFASAMAVGCSAAGNNENLSADHQAGGSGGTGGGWQSTGGGRPDIDWPEELSCPVVPQEVLVFDFRSGWWDDYLRSASPYKPVLREIASVCDTVTVEYHHVLEGSDEIRCTSSLAGETCDESFFDTESGLGAALAQDSLDDYTQVWILSGADVDGSLDESEQFFAEFFEQSSGSCVPLFIAGGDGNLRHANTIAGALALDDPFEWLNADAGISIPSAAVTIETTAQTSDHVLFQGVDTLADAVVDESPMYSDRLEENPAYEIIARDDAGHPTLAVGAVALASGDVRPFVLDAGVQRYYAIFDHPPTLAFARNIVMFLGSIGCKAEVPK